MFLGPYQSEPKKPLEIVIQQFLGYVMMSKSYSTNDKARLGTGVKMGIRGAL